MNVALRRPMSVTEFLAWEDRQSTKYEFDGFQPVAMVGVTNAHSIIQSNLIVALGTRLRGTWCRPHGSDMKISAAGRIRYPDAMVVCTPHYVVLEQMQAGAIVFHRKGDDWVSEALSGDDALLRLPAIGIEVTLSELYEGVPLMPAPDEEGVGP